MSPRPCRWVVEQERKHLRRLFAENDQAASRAISVGDTASARLRASPIKILIATADQVERYFEQQHNERQRSPRNASR